MAKQGQNQGARGNEPSNGVARAMGTGTEMQRDPDASGRYETRDTGRSVEGQSSRGGSGGGREDVERGNGNGRDDFARGGDERAQARDASDAPRQDRPDRGDADAPRDGGAWGSAGQATQARTRRWRRRAQSVADVMTRNPKTVRPSDSVQQIAQIMVDEDTGIVPVCEDRRLVGVVTDRDIVCRLVARGADLKAAKASEVMTEEVECVTERESLGDVLRVMGGSQVRRVPVVAKGDVLVGIISMADIAREADVDEDLQDAFEDISAERSFWTRLR